MVLQGDGVIATVRRLVGPTDVNNALPGTIRGDFAYQTRLNIVHASDSPASAEREINLFFKEQEIIDWEDGNERWF
jgi:nucleoside-diphosphate kinase